MRATAMHHTTFDDEIGETPTHDQIAARAYVLYMERPAGERGALDDWLEAERELRQERSVERSGPAKRPRGVRRVDHDLAGK